MLEEIQKLRLQIEAELAAITKPEDAEEFRLAHLVQRGSLKNLTDRLREVPKDQKPAVGKALNELKRFAEQRFAELQQALDAKAASSSG